MKRDCTKCPYPKHFEVPSGFKWTTINESNETADNVNHPNHYKSKSGLETIDVIRAFTEDLTGIEAVDTANALKYICRWKKKNGIEDLKKARWYLDDLINKLEGE